MRSIILHLTGKIAIYLLIATVCGEKTIVKYVTLKTKFAQLVGTQETVSSLSVPLNKHFPREVISYFAFRGIPYAEPPIGLLRWQDTIIKRPLPENVLFNATVDKSPCPQWIVKNGTNVLIGDENCLYASVFIPVQGQETPKPLKIMVFLHGGAFIVNSNRNMLPTPLLAQGNSIIIMFNYRISIFGYLSTGTSVLPGNYAFLDQICLLKWIQLYAKDFGADHNDVTIFGSSIGSVSIHYLLLSRLSAGLFHKAIMESGSALCERSLVPNPLQISMKLGSAVGCPVTKDQEILLTCLHSKSTVELMMAAKHLTVKWVLPAVLGPVIDRNSRRQNAQFLLDFPENLPIVNKVPVIVGITKTEGLTAFVKLSKEFSWNQLHNHTFIQTDILPHYLNLIMRKRPTDRNTYIQNLSKQVIQFYKKDFAADTISTLVDILGDLWINVCHRMTLEQLCMNSIPSVHTYLFSHHDPGISPSEIGADIREFQKVGFNHPVLDHGVAHTEEILYMLEDEEDIISVNGGRIQQFPRNKIMSSILSRLWTSFRFVFQMPDLISSCKQMLKSKIVQFTSIFHFISVSSAYEGQSFFTNWPKWNPICQNNGSYSLFDPEYPLFEISLDSHRFVWNYRLKEAKFWWAVHQDCLQ